MRIAPILTAATLMLAAGATTSVVLRGLAQRRHRHDGGQGSAAAEVSFGPFINCADDSTPIELLK